MSLGRQARAARKQDPMEELASALGRPVSISTQIADALRKQILDGKLKPGERIVETRLARQLGIGQPTAREALIVLEHEGLVERKPNCGCSVVELSTAEISQIYRVRQELEPLAAELAIGNGNDHRELKGAYQQLMAAARSGDADEWNRRDLEFHQALWREAGNPFLERALMQVALPFFAFAKLVYYQQPQMDLAAQAEEHGRIVAAIESGDKKAARRVTQEVLGGFRALWDSLAGKQAG
jgi:DNA-binding GntR family transcriptional regulator